MDNANVNNGQESNDEYELRGGGLIEIEEEEKEEALELP